MSMAVDVAAAGGSKAGAPNYVAFNQDAACAAVGTDTGFRIYNISPLRERSRREFTDGGIGQVEMLFRCNYLALVGGGKQPKFPRNKVFIWDDLQAKCIIELEFRSEVRAVRLRRDRIVAVLDSKVFVYSFTQTPQSLHVFETIENPRGMVALSANSTNALLCIPGRQRGHLQLVDLGDEKKSTIIPAHNGPVACIALNLEGTRLATASDKGTLIRIWDTESGTLLQELRRGTDKALIHCIAFNYNSTWVCCSSDKGTIHVFSLEAPVATQDAWPFKGSSDEPAPPNKQSSLSFMKGVLPKYFSSEWSLCQFHIPDSQSVCAFGSEKNSIIVLAASGSYYKASFDPKSGGQCKQELFKKFLTT